MPLRDMRGLVLALVPPHCGCAHLRQLAAEAITAGVELYLVGTHNVPVTALAKQTGLAASHAVEDTENALATAYRPVTLTAVLRQRRRVGHRRRPRPRHGLQADGPAADADHQRAEAAAPGRVRDGERRGRSAPPAASPRSARYAVRRPLAFRRSGHLLRTQGPGEHAVSLSSRNVRLLRSLRRGGGGRAGARDRRL